MAERRTRVERPRLTRRQRLIELGKDVLIVLLFLSAAMMAVKTPMLASLGGWMAKPEENIIFEQLHSSEAAVPYQLAVRNSWGLYAVGYDQKLVEEGWAQLTGLLGQALSTAESREKIDDSRWRELLESSGVYCVFQGRIPLDVLGSWLGGEGGPEGEGSELLLAWDGHGVWLAWRDGEQCWAAETKVSWSQQLSPLLRGFNPNGAAFAYTLAESDPLYGQLDPYVLVQLNTFQPRLYSGSSPDLVSNQELLTQFLDVMGFESGGGTAYETSEGLVISERGDRLRVGDDGHVRYHAVDESRYLVPSVEERPTDQEAALAAWKLVNQATSLWKGEGRLILTGLVQDGEDRVITFHSRLDGIPVVMGGTGWAAQFRVSGREITNFTIHLRTYTNQEETIPVPRERLAAAALPSLEREGGRLMLRYLDGHKTSVRAGWVTELP